MRVILLSRDETGGATAPDKIWGSGGAGFAGLAHEFVGEMEGDRPFNIRHSISLICGTQETFRSMFCMRQKAKFRKLRDNGPGGETLIRLNVDFLG